MLNSSSGSGSAPQPGVQSGRTIRPIRSVIVWFMGSLVIGAGAGVAFGVFLALAYDGTVFAASIVGLVYGAILATPFGLMVGGAMASLRRPRAEEEFVGMARRNGVFGLVIAGVAGAAMWPALLFAAIFGILVGWFAAPVLVRLTSQPVAPDREPATFDTALSRSRDSVARSDDEERTP